MIIKTRVYSYRDKILSYSLNVGIIRILEKIKRRDVAILYVIIPMTTLICVLFDPVIPTLSFNFIQLFFILV